MNSYLIFWAKCKQCSHEFEYLGTRDGTRQLRHPKNMRNAVEVSWLDPVFKEVGKIVDRFIADEGLDPIPASNIFDVVFGNVIDPAPDGTHYDMTGIHWCPNCGSNSMSGHGPTAPPSYWEGELPKIQYTHWDKLNQAEKEIVIQKELKRMLSESDI